MVRDMKIPERADLRAFETSVSDTIVSFSHEHAPLLRKLFVDTPEADLVYIAYCAFLGHTVDLVYRVAGRDHALAMVTNVMDQLDAVRATVAEGAKQGLSLDPYAVASTMVQSESS